MIRGSRSHPSIGRDGRTGVAAAACLVGLLSAPCGVRADATADSRAITPAEVLSLSPRIRVSWERLQLGADAALHASKGEPGSADGRFSAALRVPVRDRLGGTLAFKAATTSWPGSARSGRVQALGTLSFAAGIATGWVGAGAAKSWSGGRGFTSGIVPVGIRIHFGATQFGLRAQTNAYSNRTTSLEEVEVPGDSVPGHTSRLVERDATLVYTDASMGFGWKRDRLSFGVDLGLRLGSSAGGTRLSGSAEVGLDVTPRLALIGQGGKQPSVPEQGLPAHNFATLGLQFSLVPVPAAAPATEREAHPELRRFALQALDAGRYLIRIRVPGAELVELAGDFTNWVPVPMSSTGRSTWEVVLGIDSGPHRMNIRVDDGPWIAPPGIDTVEDEFNGRVGLFIAP